MNDPVSLMTAIAALIAAAVAPMVAIRAARLQASRQIFVATSARFWVAITAWAATVRRVASAQTIDQRGIAVVEARTLRQQIEEAYATISLLSREPWLDMHWLKRQLRVDQQLNEFQAGDGSTEGLLVHLDDYELALPTVRERLSNAARRGPR